MTRTPPLAALLLAAALAGPLAAQARGERLTYDSPADGTPLAAALTLPPGDGPFPGVVVLTLALADPLVERLTGMGWGVIVPERRGMRGSPELILRSDFGVMTADVEAARAVLAARPEVDGSRVGVLAQGVETPVGLRMSAGTPSPAFVALLAVSGLPADAAFRADQTRLAAGRGMPPADVEALDDVVTRLAALASADEPPEARASRIRALLAGAPVLPRQSSSFPSDLEGQVHFFASPWYHDALGFAPDSLLGRLASPTLVLLGRDDPSVPPEVHVPPLRRALEAAPAGDVTLCVVEGRVQHGFAPAALDALEDWLEARTASAGAGVARPSACLEDDGIG